MFYEPKKGVPFDIDPFKSLIFPRPIGWISSVNKKGIANLAPYSYFNAVTDEPPQIMFCSNGGSSHYIYKDSLSNILSTKEFVVNFATSLTRNQMNNSSKDFKPEEDEFILSKFSSYLDYTYIYKSIYLLLIISFVGIIYLISCYLLGLLKVKNYTTN